MSAKQSRLENIAINKRDSLVINNDYQNLEGHEYNETHKDAISDGDLNGKGNKISMGYAIADTNSFEISKDGTRIQKMNYSSLITTENGDATIGGEYDRNGNPNIKKSGRKGLMSINQYTPTNEYGENSVDTTQNLKLGQYPSKS